MVFCRYYTPSCPRRKIIVYYQNHNKIHIREGISMTIRHIHIFSGGVRLRVQRHQGRQQLHLTQPAVSAAIRELETLVFRRQFRVVAPGEGPLPWPGTCSRWCWTRPRPGAALSPGLPVFSIPLDRGRQSVYNLTQLVFGKEAVPVATPEQIASILSQLVALHPADCFKPIDAANAGLGAVLRLLYPGRPAGDRHAGDDFRHAAARDRFRGPRQ